MTQSKPLLPIADLQRFQRHAQKTKTASRAIRLHVTFGLLNMLADGSTIIFMLLSATIQLDVMLFGFCCIFIFLIFNRRQLSADSYKISAHQQAVYVTCNLNRQSVSK